MSDRELLVLAAKAAGIKINAKRQAERDADGYGRVGLWTSTSTNWNPLTDDGDALRLALAIPACIVIDGDMEWVGVHLDGSRGKYDVVEPFGDDKANAFRRAVVLAAAEIERAREGA